MRCPSHLGFSSCLGTHVGHRLWHTLVCVCTLLLQPPTCRARVLRCAEPMQGAHESSHRKAAARKARSVLCNWCVSCTHGCTYLSRSPLTPLLCSSLGSARAGV